MHSAKSNTYGSRGYAMKMATMRGQYRNKPQRRFEAKALRKGFKVMQYGHYRRNS